MTTIREKLANEPVLTWATIGGLLVAVGGALIGIGEGVNPAVAWGGGLIEFGVVIGAGTAARSRAYGPRTVDTVMDAEAVIRDAEGA